ncbi:MAG: MerR family transcriptional regulator, light-induced transcriptional regulator [Actinomycetota bacterium]|nr:MerR family transcriptional regulator, light-induced transcriptional regulator [Actinomycetota bacterium]
MAASEGPGPDPGGEVTGPAGPPAATAVGLGVAAVARRLGVAPGTLRTWDRRYGIGPSAHVSGTQRRYTPEDLARLSRMRFLMLQGVSPADAARSACEDAGPVDPALALVSAHRRAGRSGRSGGGRVLALREASPATRGLARAAMALDTAGVTSLVTASLSRRGVVATWNDLLVPVLVGLGDRWRVTGSGIEVEHVVAECAEDALRATTRRLRRATNVRPVLLCSVESEEHRLPVHALAAALAERSVATRVLGRLPVTALADAVARTGPAAVFVWCQGVRERADPAGLAALPVVRPTPTTVILGGPGWSTGGHPPGVVWVPDLGGAVAAVMSAVGGNADITGTSDRAAPDPR